jgi:large subunit ribosomal protein L29
MKKKEIKDLSVNDLQAQLKVEQAELDKLKLSHAVSPVDNPMKIRTTRRTIARIKTELRNKLAATK